MSNVSRSYYDVIGLPRDADQNEIDAACIRLAEKYRPDRNPGDPLAASNFAMIEEAYETLGSPERRNAYDIALPQPHDLAAASNIKTPDVTTTPVPIEKSKKNRYWPKITDIESAKDAAKQGFWAAIAVAAFNGIFATVALLTQKEIGMVGPEAYFDAALFGLIAWRVRRFSRAFAVAGIVIIVLEKALQWPPSGGGIILGIIFLLAFINGARGVFAYHRLS